MLLKYDETQIPERGDPFLNDSLARKKLAENLTRLIQSAQQPFIISLQAPWGGGKTTFIKMWQRYLESFGHACLYFNAWQSDFVEDPLIAFVGEISKKMMERQAQGKLGMQLKKLQVIGAKLTRNAVPLTVQLATQGFLSQESVKQASDFLFDNRGEIASVLSNLAEEKIKQYERDKNGLQEFRKELAEFAKSLAARANARKPLVFFVDELDRCRPSFTIALLERVKHVFSVEGVVFVLAVNREQLAHAVRAAYGAETDAEGYLRRFVDFSVNLPPPDVESFCRALYNRFDLPKLFHSRRNKPSEQQSLLKMFVKFARAYRFNLRVIEQCFTELNFFLRTIPSEAALYPEILAFLIAFKSHNPQAYEALSGEPTYPQLKEVIQAAAAELDPTDPDMTRTLAQFAAYAVYGYVEEGKIKEAVGDLSADYECERLAEPLLETAQRMSGDMRVVRDLVAALNLVF